MTRSFIAMALFAATSLSAPHIASAVEPTQPPVMETTAEAPGPEINQNLKQLADKLTHADIYATKFSDKTRPALIAKTLKKIYSDRDYYPLWVTKEGLTKRGIDLIEEIKKAGDWGLDASKIATPTLSDAPTAMELGKAEIMLSKAVITYADHARGGRILPQSLTKFLDMTPTLETPLDIIAHVHGADNSVGELLSFHPQHPQFKRLREVYLALRDGSPEKQHEKIPTGKVLKLDVADKRVPLLRARFKSPVPDEQDELTFDQDLADAVKAWQKKRGLTADGIVGSNTIRALNKKPVNKLTTVLVNMERWRWMKHDLGNLHIFNNIPEQVTRMVKNGKTMHKERIVVGKLTNMTPVFSDEMEHLVFGPTWNVPASIKVKEILPSLRRSTSVLTRQNLRVTYRGRAVDPASINWDIADIRKYHVYQPPGSRNVLGRVKFMFPNDHIVYMHDTTSKSLFNKKRRLYSHGCMRVRNPLKLAQHILGQDKGWSAGKVAYAFNNGHNQFVHLNKPIPVHISYMTARVTDEGKLITHPDVYGHDKRVKAALDGKYIIPTPRTKRRNYAEERRKRQREYERRRREPSNLFEAIFGQLNN